MAAGSYYSADNTIADAESTDFSFEIEGFTKADKAAVKKAEFKASELGEGFKDKDFAAFNTEMNREKWLFDNKTKYLDGDFTSAATDKSFIQRISGQNAITFTQVSGQPTKATMSFAVDVGKTYDEQGVVSKAATPITFIVLIGQ